MLHSRKTVFLLSALLFAACFASQTRADETSNARPPRDEADLRYWLENMVWHHRFSTDEIRDATGMGEDAIGAALKKFDIREETRPRREADAPLRVLPYPGGRHPRIGFLDGAVDPQRESKVSVFAPWGDRDYAVVDVPEAIWSNLGLTYLAHTHVPTIWSKQGIELERLEWERRDDGTYFLERKLPNGIVFATTVSPGKDGVRMKITLTNGTKQELSDLRVQNCVMLKGMPGFDQQTNDNKLLQEPYVACKSEGGQRWIITAWSPCHRPWANPPCPCLHSDPKFPDCPPGESRTIRGWLSFYEGDDIQAELKRLEELKWDQGDR